LVKNNLPFWHLSFRPSLADFHSQNPRNSWLFLWFCSIRSANSNPNLSANSAKLFLTKPLASLTIGPALPALVRQRIENADAKQTRPALARQKLENATE